MKRIARFLGPILCLAGLAACGAQTASRSHAAGGGPASQCIKGGDWCRWDGQCCSGRCYVDTGCSG